MKNTNAIRAGLSNLADRLADEAEAEREIRDANARIVVHENARRQWEDRKEQARGAVLMMMTKLEDQDIFITDKNEPS